MAPASIADSKSLRPEPRVLTGAGASNVGAGGAVRPIGGPGAAAVKNEGNDQTNPTNEEQSIRQELVVQQSELEQEVR